MASRWIPLESNPDVLNSWSSKAGLVTTLVEFGDVYGLDESLLAMVPQPVKAVVLLFPISKESETRREQEDAEIKSKGQPELDPTIFWIKQTISNACGTMGLIHAIANSDATLEPGSPLAKFIDQCQDKTPEERAKLLETTPLFADIHAQAATSGQSAVPTNLDTDLHFTCFVAAPSPAGPTDDGPSMRVVELDGRRDGPIDRGKCTDLLTDAAKIIREQYIGESQSMQFNVMSLGPLAS
ncbi:Ubiquitin carboxyl-terminal hydrolase [Mycena venus]|uniref:Ubiquitin carboxyl-terminal hydrolase n=1 Tax=Mycena venus TaxID=2733690 RepID=A0A8H6YDI0_9AGAR|nr:Ubiquitin carboxyl-terminal hydrolase [Mycena venus]